jgi:hypothetical protein
MIVTRIFGVEENGNGEEKISFDYGAIFVSSTAELVGTIIVVALVDRVGRIPIQTFSFFIGGIGLFLLCLFSSFGMTKIVLVALAFSVRICEMIGKQYCIDKSSNSQLD